MEKISFPQSGLPELPKKNKKREADFGLIFRNFIEENPQFESAQFELKDTRGKDSFIYAELDESQVHHALRAKTPKGNLIRIINGTPGAPDYVFFRSCQYSFIVIRYASGTAYVIDIDDLLRERDHSSRKSLTEDTARLLSTVIID